MKNRRRGFTLVALLVLLAIGGVLMAMFFPAVLKVREASQRMSCRNNLHQIAIAVHDRESDLRRFPPAGMGEPDHQKEGSGSWCFVLLPYLERDELFKDNGGKVPVSTFYCSSRRPAKLYNDLPKSDYAGSVGTADDPEKPNKDNGTFNEKGIRFADILDGSSNTLMIGEKNLRKTDYLTGRGAGDRGSCWAGGTMDTLRSSNEDKRSPVRDAADADHERAFGSAHDRGCNFVFCDGHVRHISYSIKGSIFQALCTRNGGEVLNAADF